MNGRIYSPKLGRMLSPDPVTQAPENGQNYDRYTYAFNNPLKYTDPSGYKNDNDADIDCSDSCISNPGASNVGMEEVLVVAQDLSSSSSGNLAPLAFGMSSQQALNTELKEHANFNVAINQADQNATLILEDGVNSGEIVGKLSSGDVLTSSGEVINISFSASSSNGQPSGWGMFHPDGHDYETGRDNSLLPEGGEIGSVRNSVSIH